MNIPFLALAQEGSLLEVELGFVILLAIAAIIAVLIRRIRLPYTVALVLAGLLLTLLPIPFEIELSSDLILAFLVPPLIFEATLHLNWTMLRRNLRPILLLAIAGTLISTFIVGGIIYIVGGQISPHPEIPIAAALAFGALISATDPVAVISFFSSLGVSKRLALLVEGESLFNDGVAIVLFNLALGAGAIAAGGSGESLTLGSAVLEFITVSAGGIGVGILVGLVVSYFILRSVDDHLIETATTVAVAFGSFIIAEELAFSGILAVVAAGILVGNFGMRSTTATTRITLHNFWEFMAFAMNSLVFLLLGLDTELSQFAPNIIPIAVAVVAVLLSRAIVVYLLSWIHSRLDSASRIPKAYRHVLYWGGLRGAISLALGLRLAEGVFAPEISEQLKMMTYGVVLFTLLVQGTTIRALLGKLRLAEKSTQFVEQQRRQGLLYAARAGQRELDRLLQDGIISVHVREAMMTVYTDEIHERDRELRSIMHEYPELEQEMVLQARADILRAERSAIADATYRGLISEEAHRELISESDDRSAALEVIRSGLGFGFENPEEVER